LTDLHFLHGYKGHSDRRESTSSEHDQNSELSDSSVQCSSVIQLRWNEIRWD